MKKPVWNKDQGLKLIRYGGLSPVKQDNKRAPANQGLWAFIYPYFDFFFLGASFSHDKWNKDKDGHLLKPKSNLRKVFWHHGDIFTHIEIPGSIPWKRGNQWHLTTDRELFDYLSVVAKNDLAYIRKDLSEWGVDPVLKINPYSSGMYGMGIDHLEVFIPKFPIRR